MVGLVSGNSSLLGSTCYKNGWPLWTTYVLWKLVSLVFFKSMQICSKVYVCSFLYILYNNNPYPDWKWTTEEKQINVDLFGGDMRKILGQGYHYAIVSLDISSATCGLTETDFK